MGVFLFFRSLNYWFLYTFRPAFRTRFFSVIAMSEESTMRQSVEIFPKIEIIVTQKKELKQMLQSGLEFTFRFLF